jgi:hypothetical protein
MSYQSEQQQPLGRRPQQKAAIENFADRRRAAHSSCLDADTDGRSGRPSTERRGEQRARAKNGSETP